MKTTWLDRLRGEGQGRTIPNGFVAPDGQHVFVLGGDGVLESAILTGGDYTEVKQVVDLTNWDLVAATMNTIGKVMGQAQAQPGLLVYHTPLWHFNYNIGTALERNLIDGAFDLENQGNMEVDNEDYSPVLTRCRKIPVGSTTAYMLGENTPQWCSLTWLDHYTFQMWLKFDAESHAASWGINPTLFKCVDGVPQGIDISLEGVVGPPNKWRVKVTHHEGGGSASALFTPFVFETPNRGWTLITICFDWTLPIAQRIRMYIDNNLGPYWPVVNMTRVPKQPAVGTPVEVAHPDLWGMFDEMLLIPHMLSYSEMLDTYDAATIMPTPVDYEWLMQIRVNGEVYGERVVRPGEERRWTDFKAPVRHINGEAEVAFRLTLQEI